MTRKRVLLIDDCEDNLILLSAILIRSGFDVDTASNAIEGIELAAKNQYAVILMDIQMPHLDGFHAMRRLREQGCSVPVVAVTAAARSRLPSEFQEAGFYSHFEKPVDRDQFVSSILQIAN